MLENMLQSDALDAARNEALRNILNIELFEQGAVSANGRDRYANQAMQAQQPFIYQVVPLNKALPKSKPRPILLSKRSKITSCKTTPIP